MRNLIYILLLFCSVNSFAQNKVELLNKGNIEFNNGDFQSAEQLYKQSLEKDSSYYKANVNLAHSLYKQERFDESTSFYKNALGLTDKKSDKAISHYNLGNSQLREGKVEESIKSYKNSLRIRPNNMNAKRNLAIAQSLLKEQEKKEEEKEEEKEEKKEEENKEKEPQAEPKDEISKEELEQILKALERKEMEVQEDLQKKKVVGKSKNLKDW